MDLTRDDSGATREVRVGERLVVRLGENPTTGYRWQPEVEGGVTLADDRYEGATQPVGSGGERVLAFTATGPGPARIRLVQRRAWESEVADEFRLDLDVRPG